jgi:carbonic anhydrase/acetyltransferase-like protein (isoleucine patch superfamily)
VIRSYKGRLPTVHSTAYVDESAQVIGDVEFIGYAERHVGYRLDYLGGADAASRR